MIRIFFLVCYFLVSVSPVYAVEPDCGEADKSLLEDVYEAAERVEFYNDVVSDIESACLVLEEFEDWYKSKRRSENLSKDIKRSKKKLIRGFDGALRSLHGPLIAYFGYIYAERNNESRAVRIARIISARKKVNSARANIISHSDEIAELMEDHAEDSQ